MALSQTDLEKALEFMHSPILLSSGGLFSNHPAAFYPKKNTIIDR